MQNPIQTNKFKIQIFILDLIRFLDYFDYEGIFYQN